MRAAQRWLLRPLALLALAAACSCGRQGGAADLTLERALAADWGALETELVTNMPAERKGGLAVVFLHGYGATGPAFAGIARELAGDDTRVFLPTAVLPHASGRGSMWWEFFDGDWPKPYSTDSVSNTPPEPSRQLPQARAAVIRLLDEIRNRHRPDAVVLFGFSQGAMLALDVGATAEPPVDRLVLAAGYLLHDSMPAVTAERAQRPRVLIVHGRRDATVPFERAELLRDVLGANGFVVAFRPHDGGHSLDDAAVREIWRYVRGEDAGASQRPAPSPAPAPGAR